MNINRDRFAEGLGRGLGNGFIGWVKDQVLHPKGSKASAMIALGFVCVSVGWYFSSSSPEIVLQHAQRLDTIYQHFVLDMDDISQKRFHVLVTHGFFYQDLLHTILMTLPILFFGNYLERRLGGICVIVVFFTGVIAGGSCQICVGDPNTFQLLVNHLSSLATDYPSLDWIATEVKTWLTDFHENRAEENSFMGPAAGVAALMTFSLFMQLMIQPSRIFLIGGLAGTWVMIDWFGFFHFESTVGITARIVGCVIGLVLSMFCYIVSRPRKLRFRMRNSWCYAD